jgi:hypothetical protein
MNWTLMFSRDTRHLRILAFLLLVSGAAAMGVRQQFVPASFGEYGPYSGDALRENLDRPMLVSSDAKCLKCHESVGEQRAESPHQTVACMHCHGLGDEHIKHAEMAALSSDHEIPAAVEWDGDFKTQVDFYISHDKASCLACHQKVVGMPDSFRSINVAEHLEEQRASEPMSKNVCFECHDGHSPGL